MDLPATLALLAFLFPLAYSPGPGNQFFAALGARSGMAATVPALAGYHVATWLVTIAIGAGVGAALLERPVALSVLTALGGVYMGWLGWRAWRSAGESLEGKEGTEPGAAGFGAGVLLLLLNAKAYVIIALMFASFSVSGSPLQIAWVSTVFTLNNAVAFVVWAAIGDGVARWARRRGAGRTVDRLFAVAIVGVGLWLVWRALAG